MSFRNLRRRLGLLGTWCAVVCCAAMGLCGCKSVPDPIEDIIDDDHHMNTTDKTNGGASYVGSGACKSCHPQVGAWHELHGHGNILTPTLGQPPQFPSEAEGAGVPDPPAGFDWSDISWVIGGYTKRASFAGLDGYLLTNGVDGVDSQWNLDFLPNGTAAGFVEYEPSQVTPKPYDFSCFQCHTTAPAAQDPGFPEFEENRPGFVGTWGEAGVMCESCHGPGSNHFNSVEDRALVDPTKIFVDVTGTKSCFECHNRPFDSRNGKILAGGGYIKNQEQYPELKASGGHSEFACTFCHSPHRSVFYDRAGAIRNDCTDCHSSQNMALHEGKVFARDGYVEALRCESCHMTYATRSASVGGVDVVGAMGRMGDTQTHIFRISTEDVGYEGMFTADGSEVIRDGAGRAKVTVDFVCLRCHNEATDNPFALTIEFASEIAIGMHGGS